MYMAFKKRTALFHLPLYIHQLRIIKTISVKLLEIILFIDSLILSAFKFLANTVQQHTNFWAKQYNVFYYNSLYIIEANHAYTNKPIMFH